jgi:hypothetical protein
MKDRIIYGFLASILLACFPVFSAFTVNSTLIALADNTALDLGAYTCTGPVGESSSYCRGVTDYSGMVYDPHRQTICLWGGGHSTTFRDDIDVFNFQTLDWDSTYVPTPCAEMITSNLNSDQASWISTGHPVSRHSYDLLIVSGNGEFLMMRAGGGRGSCYAGPTWLPSGKVGHYNFSTKQWSWGTSMSSAWSNLGSAEYDPVSGLVVIVDGSSLWTYDPVSKTKTGRKSISLPGYANNLVYFPPNDKFYYFARGNPTGVYELTVDRDNWSNSSVVQVTGMSGTPSSQESGWAYDAANDVIGGGVRDGQFHAYNPLSRQWTTKTIQENSSASVGTQHFHAIDYDPINNVYIILANRHTWAYRYAKGNWTPNAEQSRVRRNMVSIAASPNPFRKLLNIAVSCQPSAVSKINLQIYNINGKLIKRLNADSRKLTAGITWNAFGNPPGLYLVKVKIGNNTYTKRIMLLK